MQALLVLDVVNAIFELPVPLHEPAAFVEHVRDLTARARAAGVPVVYFQHVGAEGSRFAPGSHGRAIAAAVAPHAGDIVLDKREPDMFHGTGLAELLAARGVDELIVCGFATEGCVDTTVRSAYARGFRVVLAAGAHTTTQNRTLTAEQVVRHHDEVLARFARVVPAADVAFG